MIVTKLAPLFLASVSFLQIFFGWLGSWHCLRSLEHPHYFHLHKLAGNQFRVNGNFVPTTHPAEIAPADERALPRGIAAYSSVPVRHASDTAATEFPHKNCRKEASATLPFLSDWSYAKHT
jgi:hypothetical protein